MRLIDADALKPLLREYCVDGDEVVMKWYDIMGIDDVVDRAPTIDAVPVVRCKDCKWQDKGENDSESWNMCMYRPWSYKQIEDTDFCSDGKRRDDE